MKPTAIQNIENRIASARYDLAQAKRELTLAEQWLPVLSKHPDAHISTISQNELELAIQFYNCNTAELAYLPSYDNVVNVADAADSDGPTVFQKLQIAPGATLSVFAYFNWADSDKELLVALGNLAPATSAPYLALTCGI